MTRDCLRSLGAAPFVCTNWKNKSTTDATWMNGRIVIAKDRVLKAYRQHQPQVCFVSPNILASRLGARYCPPFSRR